MLPIGVGVVSENGKHGAEEDNWILVDGSDGSSIYRSNRGV